VLSPIPPSYIDVTRLYLSKELGPKIDRRSKPLSKKQRAHQNLNPNTTIPFPNKNSKLNPSTQTLNLLTKQYLKTLITNLITIPKKRKFLDSKTYSKIKSPNHRTRIEFFPAS
jgi:hypothetical protein